METRIHTQHTQGTRTAPIKLHALPTIAPADCPATEAWGPACLGPGHNRAMSGISGIGRCKREGDGGVGRCTRVGDRRHALPNETSIYEVTACVRPARVGHNLSWLFGYLAAARAACAAAAAASTAVLMINKYKIRIRRVRPIDFSFPLLCVRLLFLLVLLFVLLLRAAAYVLKLLLWLLSLVFCLSFFPA